MNDTVNVVTGKMEGGASHSNGKCRKKNTNKTKQPNKPIV